MSWRIVRDGLSILRRPVTAAASNEFMNAVLGEATSFDVSYLNPPALR